MQMMLRGRERRIAYSIDDNLFWPFLHGRLLLLLADGEYDVVLVNWKFQQFFFFPLTTFCFNFSDLCIYFNFKSKYITYEFHVSAFVS